MTVKILCLGNNTEDTDIQTQTLALQKNLPCFGLLTELEGPLELTSYQQSGLYHSSIYDIEFGRLTELCNQFDQVIMLAQPKSQWTHPDAFYRTVKLLGLVSVPVVFQDPSFKNAITYFEELVNTNKSFCIFPFIELLVNYDSTTVCCRSDKPITKLQDLKDFASDKNYQYIRSKMLAGELIPEHCRSCYQIEEQGILSARQQETVEWANRLNLQSPKDLEQLSDPAYYEIRADNKCNLLCRICNPLNSHLIEKEYKTIGLISSDPLPKQHSTGFDIVKFDNLKKLYIAGGEPTVLAEFYQFLDRCINSGQTDFEFLVNTNGTNIKNRLKEQLKHFSNFQFVFSIDGYQDLNHYIRWPSAWHDIMDNWRYLKAHNHKVFVNTTVSIYNIASLDRLFEFVDLEFPGTLIHCNLLTGPRSMSPFLYPYPKQALESLERIRSLDCYKNDLLFASSIDGCISQFEAQRSIDTKLLAEFYDFNDKLDHSRNISLKDYVPDLDNYRFNIV